MARLDARKADAEAKAEAAAAKSAAAAMAAAPSATPAATSATSVPVSGSALAPVYPAGDSLNESRTSSSPPGSSGAPLPRATAVPSLMSSTKAAVTPPSKRPLKADTTRGVAAAAVDAKGNAEGMNTRTAIVVDGEDSEVEEGRQEGEEKKRDKKDDVVTRAGREASRANGEAEDEDNYDVSAQTAVKQNAPKRPGSPAVPAASTSGVSAAFVSKSPNWATAAGDDPKTSTKVRKGPAPAVASSPRKTTSSPSPTLMGWMAPAAGHSSSGAAVINKEEGTNGSKANNGAKGDIDNGSGKTNANGDAEGVAEPVKAPTPALTSAPVAAMSPSSRMTRRRSKSLGKDGSEGSK